MAFKYLLLAAFIVGSTWAETEPSISDTINKNLPPELRGKVNETDIEQIKNQTTAVFKEKCEKNGGTEAFLKAQKAVEDFPNCVKESLGLSDPAVLQREIEDAKPNGAVDEVFKKYCAKSPQAKKCFRNMTEVIKPCFAADEQKNLNTIYNVTEQLTEFICFKDGDRIALFIAEGGPECFQEKQEQIQQCVNDTFGEDIKFNANDISANSLPDIAFGEKECNQFTELQKCVVEVLEKCKAPTSANIVESLFKFARQATPCRNETKPGAASGLAVTSATIIIGLATTLMF